MTDWGHIEALFHEMVALGDVERRRRLEALRVDQPAVAGEVARLLAADDQETHGSFLAEHAEPALGPRPASDLPLPLRVGTYTILGILGEGGMGVVYEAQQHHPRRRVAVKIIRAGFAHREMLRRFEREGQVLGVLAHPGIAHVYEAGVAEVEYPAGDASAGPGPQSPGPSERGLILRQPFLAMELVRGTSLTRYAQTHALTPRESVALFALVCEAVEHAHAHGIVHRDLKPANILVDENGRPKLLDFGIARARGAELAAATLATLPGQIIGTLAYMSPEQVSGMTEPDASCDVYALGVMLYELMLGRPPFDLSRCSMAEAARIIRDEDPSGLDAAGSRGGRSAAQRLDRDLQTIILKAMEKDLSRRYATAGELGDDVRRYLSERPIVARPASRFYQFRKYARRNKPLVGGFLATVLALILGAVLSIRFALDEREQRRLANEKTDEALRLAYRSSLSAASAALQQDQPEGARGHLASAPAELRGWEWVLLEHMTDRSVQTFSGSAGAVLHSALSADERTLATIDPGGVVQIWDCFTGTVRLRFIAEQSSPPGLISLNADGSLLLIGRSPSGRFAVYDTAHGARLWDGDAGRSGVGGSFSPDGSSVAFAGEDGETVQLFDPTTGELRGEIRCGSAASRLVQIASFTADGKRMLTQHGGCRRLTDVATQAMLGEMCHWETVISADHADYVLVFSPTEGGRLERRTFPDHGLAATRPWPDAYQTGWWLPEGLGVVIVSPEGRARLLARDLAEIASFSLPSGATVYPSSDGRSVLTVAPQGAIQRFSAPVAEAPYILPHPLRFVSCSSGVSPDGRSVAHGDWCYVRLHDGQTGALRWITCLPRRTITAVGFSADGALVAASDLQGRVAVLDARDGRLRVEHPPLGHAVYALDVSGDGQRCIAARADGTLTVFDLRNDGLDAIHLPGHTSPVQCVARHEPTSRIASGSGDGVVRPYIGPTRSGLGDHSLRIWNLENGTCEGIVKLASPVLAVQFLSGGAIIAATTLDGALHFIQVEDRRVIRSLANLGEIRALAVHPREPRLAAFRVDGGVLLVDTQRLEPIVALPRAASRTTAAAFSPDGNTLRGAGTDAALVVFECGTLAAAEFDRVRLIWAYQRLNRERLALLEDGVAGVAADMDLPEDVREAALQQMRLAGDHVGWLISDAIDGVRARVKDPQRLTDAIRRARWAAELLSDDPGATTLLAGAYHYGGFHQESLEASRQTIRRCEAHGLPLEPDASALYAMALLHLGRGEEARSAYAEMLTRLTPEYLRDRDARDILLEAQRLIAPDTPLPP